MRQKKSVYGNINTEGKPFAVSLILNNRQEDFLEEVEDGIKQVVRACIETGLDTYSSCQGHDYEGNVYKRFCDIIIEEKYMGLWIEYIEELCVCYNISLEYEILEYSNPNRIINYNYSKPIRFKILFIDTNEEKREYATRIFAQSISNKQFPQFI